MKLSESLHPLLTAERLAHLADHQVERLAQLLVSPPEQLAAILEISFTKVTTLLEDLSRDFCPSPESGLDIYQRQAMWLESISTGSAQIDDVLCGGLRPGTVYDVYGGAGAGKTQLCLQLAASSVRIRQEGCVFYIDTKNDFCGERLLEIWRSGGGNAVPPDLGQLDRIHVARAFHPDDLCELLRRVVRRLSQDLATVQLLVVDNLSSPLMPFVGTDDIKEAFRLSGQISQLVAQIACKGVAVFCSHQARTKNGVIVPSLGKIWANFPRVRLKLSRDVTMAGMPGCRRLISVEESARRSLAQPGATCTVCIADAGLI